MRPMRPMRRPRIIGAMQIKHVTRSGLAAAALLATILVAGAGCTQPGATPEPATGPPASAPAPSPSASDGDSPFPSGDACSIATPCASPTG